MEAINNIIQRFESLQFGELRTAKRQDGAVCFCLLDVARALGITNTRNVKKRLKVRGVFLMDAPTNGGLQSLTFIDEANLYRCIFQSRKPEAVKFQEWVFDEVLPSIIQSGVYIASKPDDSKDDIIKRAVECAKRILLEAGK